MSRTEQKRERERAKNGRYEGKWYGKRVGWFVKSILSKSILIVHRILCQLTDSVSDISTLVSKYFDVDVVTFFFLYVLLH